MKGQAVPGRSLGQAGRGLSEVEEDERLHEEQLPGRDRTHRRGGPVAERRGERLLQVWAPCEAGLPVRVWPRLVHEIVAYDSGIVREALGDTHEPLDVVVLQPDPVRSWVVRPEVLECALHRRVQDV